MIWCNAVDFIVYIISPAGGSTRNNKQHKGKMKLVENKIDTIVGTAAGDGY